MSMGLPFGSGDATAEMVAATVTVGRGADACMSLPYGCKGLGINVKCNGFPDEPAGPRRHPVVRDAMGFVVRLSRLGSREDGVNLRIFAIACMAEHDPDPHATALEASRSSSMMTSGLQAASNCHRLRARSCRSRTE